MPTEIFGGLVSCDHTAQYYHDGAICDICFVAYHEKHPETLRAPCKGMVENLKTSFKITGAAHHLRLLGESNEQVKSDIFRASFLKGKSLSMSQSSSLKRWRRVGFSTWPQQ